MAKMRIEKLTAKGEPTGEVVFYDDESFDLSDFYEDPLYSVEPADTVRAYEIDPPEQMHRLEADRGGEPITEEDVERENQRFLNSSVQKGLDYMSPMRATLMRNMEEKLSANDITGLPNTIASTITGLIGAAGDAASWVASPVKIVSQAAVKAAPKIIEAAQALKASSAANFARAGGKNTLDAVIVNNANRAATGQELDVGLPELIGGSAGGAVGGRGDIAYADKILKAKNFASRNNKDINFAEEYVKYNLGGNQKGKAAIEEVIMKELKPNETFENAVDRIRGNLDNLNNEFYTHFDEVKDLKVNTNPKEIFADVEDFVIKNNKLKNFSYVQKIQKNLKEDYENYLKMIAQDRLVKTGGISEAEAMASIAKALEKKNNNIYKMLGNLTLGELDFIKRGMQSNANYARSQDAMARRGLEDISNREGSKGVRRFLENQSKADESLSNVDKLGMIESLGYTADNLENAFGKMSENIDDAYLQALKENEIISGKQIKIYNDLNMARHNEIGKKDIFEKADEKFNFSPTGAVPLNRELGYANEKYRDVTGAIGRQGGTVGSGAALNKDDWRRAVMLEQERKRNIEDIFNAEQRRQTNVKIKPKKDVPLPDSFP